MRSNMVATWITGAAVILGGCASGDGENADCIGPPLMFEGTKYDPSPASIPPKLSAHVRAED